MGFVWQWRSSLDGRRLRGNIFFSGSGPKFPLALSSSSSSQQKLPQVFIPWHHFQDISLSQHLILEYKRKQAQTPKKEPPGSAKVTIKRRLKATNVEDAAAAAAAAAGHRGGSRDSFPRLRSRLPLSSLSWDLFLDSLLTPLGLMIMPNIRLKTAQFRSLGQRYQSQLHPGGRELPRSVSAIKVSSLHSPSTHNSIKTYQTNDSILDAGVRRRQLLPSRPLVLQLVNNTFRPGVVNGY